MVDFSGLPDQDGPDLSSLPDQGGPDFSSLPDNAPITIADAPKSVMSQPSSLPPVSLNFAPPTAQAPTPGVEIRSPSQGIRTVSIYQPDEADVVGVLSKITPAERVVARQVLQRDVRSREDMNFLQGHLEEFGKKHGFGLTAGLIEALLNPMSVAETAMFESVSGLAPKIYRSFIRTGAKEEVAISTPEVADLPVSAVEIFSRAELEARKSSVLPALQLPPDIPRVTPNDPLGMMQKRLALPGEEGAEIITAERISANDPMGIMKPKTYRVIPMNKPIPDSLVKDVTGEGLRNIVLNQDTSIEQAVADTIKTPMKVSGKTKSEIASENVVNMVRDQTNTPDDLKISAEAARAIQLETEIFQDPERVIENLKQMPMNGFQRGYRWFASIYNSGRDLAKLFGPVGEQIEQRASEAAVVGQARAGSVSKILNQVLPTFEKDPILSSNLVDFLEGKALPISPEVKKAGIAIRGMMDQVGTEASQLGLKIHRTKSGLVHDWVPRENYWPHFYDLEAMAGGDTAVREKIISQVMESHELTRQKAISLIDNFVTDSQRKFGPLEVGRTTNLPGYSRDVRGVLNTYFQGAFHRLEMARQFGAENEVVGQLVGALEDPFQKKYLDAIIQQMTGKTSQGAVANLAREGESKFLKLMAKSFMPLSSLMNSTQGLYGSFVKTNTESTLKAAIQAFTKAGKQEAQESGALLEKFSDLFGKYADQGNFFSKNGFRQTEEFNRTLQYMAQKNYMEGTLTRILKANPSDYRLERELRHIGLNPDPIIRRGKFTQDELTKGSLAATRLTQGAFDAGSMPIFSEQPLGKILYHLRSFDLLQWKFARDYVLDEFKHGNIKPLVKLATGGVVVGEAQAALWGAISGREQPEEIVDRIVNDLSFASSLGIMTDLVSAVTTGKKDGVARFLNLPSQTMGQDFINSAVDLRAGKLSSAVSTLGKRVAVPAAVSIAGKINAPIGLAAAVGTRAMVDRTVKLLREEEGE